LLLLKATPSLSAKALASQMGISPRAVEKQMGILKNAGRLQRLGPAKGGQWKVLQNE
jgi:ATP-dependent DNA helicase RecG